MSNTPVTMNERRVSTLLNCVRLARNLAQNSPHLGLVEDPDLEPAEHMLVAALARIRDNEERIARKRLRVVRR